MIRHLHRGAPVLALILVNVFGTLGQYQWARHALTHDQDSIIAAGFAATLESISLFLTAEASKAMLADVRSGTLRLGAYAVGLLVGVMNYVAHAGPHWSPTAMALAFGALSTLSPWLWTVHTRGVHRRALQDQGLVDPRSVKFPLLLWVLAPASTFRMFRLGVMVGSNDPNAVRALTAERSALASLTPADAVRYAYGQLGRIDAHAARVWLQQRGRLVDTAALDAVTPPVEQPVEPAPVSSAPAPAEPTQVAQTSARTAAEPVLVSALPALGDKTTAVRNALHLLGSDASVVRVRSHLADQGVTVSEALIRKVRSVLTAEVSSENPAAPTPINGNRPTLKSVPA